MNAWLQGSRLFGRRRRRADLAATREELLRRLAPGASFVDVGGMWNVHGEVAFRAEREGASEVTLLDAMDPTEEFWREVEGRSSRVRYVQGDLHDPVTVEELGRFDVVWCAGVIYHSPNPFEQLENLRRLCAGHLVLGSHVIPEVPGIEQACIWYPGISAGARRDFARAHGPISCYGVTEPLREEPMMGFVNYWWGISLSALRGMLEAARFEVVEEHRHSRFLVHVLARPVDRPSVIPPPEFARERGRERLAGS
jgi:hypothetical protein